MTTLEHFLLAALLAGVVVGTAGALRFLSYSGALAGFVVGFLIFGFGGIPFAVPLLVFFFSSSLLSRAGRARKAAVSEKYDKSAVRDVLQVVANGGIPAVLAFLSAFAQAPRQVMLLYLCTLAAVTADTWATEIGALSRRKPRLISTLRPVEPGTSGAVSFLGFLAALVGALVIALSARLAWPHRSFALMWPIDAPEIIAVTWAGLLGAYIDSLLGATLQVQYRCGRCDAITERTRHCNSPCRPARGLRWMTNDTVNLLASLSGLIAGWLLLRYFAYPTSPRWIG